MAVAIQEKWTCDLCGQGATTEANKKPDGWAKIEIADRYVDRSWTAKCVCDSCSRQIVTETVKDKKHG